MLFKNTTKQNKTHLLKQNGRVQRAITRLQDEGIAFCKLSVVQVTYYMVPQDYQPTIVDKVLTNNDTECEVGKYVFKRVETS